MVPATVSLPGWASLGVRVVWTALPDGEVWVEKTQDRKLLPELPVVLTPMLATP